MADFVTAGPLILSIAGSVSNPGGTSISFNPALVHMTKPVYAPIQRINVADNGKVHIFQLSTNEELRWDLEFEDLPYFDDLEREQTQGFSTLRSFIRNALNYSQILIDITSPDGEVENMRYIQGIETFIEAAGQSRKKGRWTGTLHFRRQL